MISPIAPNRISPKTIPMPRTSPQKSCQAKKAIIAAITPRYTAGFGLGRLSMPLNLRPRPFTLQGGF